MDIHTCIYVHTYVLNGMIWYVFLSFWVKWKWGNIIHSHSIPHHISSETDREWVRTKERERERLIICDCNFSVLFFHLLNWHMNVVFGLKCNERKRIAENVAIEWNKKDVISCSSISYRDNNFHKTVYLRKYYTWYCIVFSYTCIPFTFVLVYSPVSHFICCDSFAKSDLVFTSKWNTKRICFCF